MSLVNYQAESKIVGREPFTTVDLVLDACSLTYGVAPCTASGPAATKCYNTFATCQDTANFAKTTFTYTFIPVDKLAPPNGSGFPCLVGEPEFTPAVLKRNEGFGALGSVKVTLKDFVWPDRGYNIDKYLSGRTHDVSQGTFFGKLKARNPNLVGKQIYVRSGYITADYRMGNTVAYQPGADIYRVYIIQSLDGPDANGIVTITGKDPLLLTSGASTKIPKPYNVTLLNSKGPGYYNDIQISLANGTYNDTIDFDGTAIKYPTFRVVAYGMNTEANDYRDAGTLVIYQKDSTVLVGDVDPNGTNTLNPFTGALDITFKVDDSGFLPEEAFISFEHTNDIQLAGEYSNFPTTGGVVKINEELIRYESRASMTLSATGMTRGYRGTIAATHEGRESSDEGVVGDKVTLCYSSHANPAAPKTLMETVEDILLNYTDIPSSFISTTNFDPQGWFSGVVNPEIIIQEPTGVQEVLKELCKQYGFSIWWDERDQVIRLDSFLVPIFPNEDGTISSESNIIRGTLDVVENPSNLVSSVWVYYGLVDASKSKTDPSNYQKVYISANTDISNPDFYNINTSKEIFAYHLRKEDTIQALTLANRFMRSNSTVARRVQFSVDAKDIVYKTGDLIEISLDSIQDFYGASESFIALITSAHESEAGHVLKFNSEITSIQGRYGFITDEAMVVYTSATALQKEDNAFIEPETGFADGGDPYKVI